MQQTSKSLALAGVALVGASVIAMTPVAGGGGASPGFFFSSREVTRDVTLAAGADDLLAPWIDQFNTASADATTLLNTFSSAPLVGLQQFIANQSGFLQDLFNDPTSINAVVEQFQSNLDAVVTGYGLQNATTATMDTVLAHTLDGVYDGEFSTDHALLFSEAPGYFPADEAATLTAIVDFLASPASGIIIGDIGPFISPWIALFNSIDAGDNLNEIFANVVGAFFNGADLNLDSLLPLINGSGYFPAGMVMNELDIAFGGLLSTGGVGAAGDGVGGSIFNSLGVYFTGVPVKGTLDLTSHPIGPIGALEGWGQTIAALLGWDGSGSPLADVTLPIIPADFLDGGTAAATAAADLSTWVQDLLAAF